MFVIKVFRDAWLVIVILAITVGIYFPARHARHYSCLGIDDILQSMHWELNNRRDNLQNCNYRDVVFSPESNVRIEDIVVKKTFSLPSPGGEHIPNECNALLSSAVIVPYRDRPEQLEIFLNYIHHFLQKQKLQYGIFIVDQQNDLLFNRAKLLNIGAKVAIEKGFSCLVLHDVDLIPLNYANIYGCSNMPRHMSSSLDTFRYNLPYLTLFGGAVAILSEQFKKMNGMSNLFEGWGGEDDDFYKRLDDNDLTPCRFCPPISRYTMLPHKKNTKNSENRFKLLKNSIERYHFDGLNALNDNYTIVLKPLYTHIKVF